MNALLVALYTAILTEATRENIDIVDWSRVGRTDSGEFTAYVQWIEDGNEYVRSLRLEVNGRYVVVSEHGGAKWGFCNAEQLQRPAFRQWCLSRFAPKKYFVAA